MKLHVSASNGNRQVSTPILALVTRPCRRSRDLPNFPSYPMGTRSLFPRIKASRIVNLRSAELKNVRGLPPRPVFDASQYLG